MLLITLVETNINVFSRHSWTNLTLHFLTWFNYAAQLHPSLGKVKGKGKISPDQWMEKLKMRNLSWSMNGLEIFKVLNWLLSQYRKTIVAEFFSKTHSPVLEMILLWKQTPSHLLKFADIFETSFLQEHAPAVTSFWQHDKPIIRERNVINFGGYFIYGAHFMNRQCQASDKGQIRKCKNIASKQPLNWIRLIQAGNIQGCFVDFKLYFSLSKLIQSLFKSVFI